MNFIAPRAVMSRNGFTLVELLIVIVVIGILAALSVNIYAGIQNRAKIAQTQHNISIIKKAMFEYKIDYGELPPIGDDWNYDTDPPSEYGWLLALNALVDAGYLSPTSAVELRKDPWGHTYGYDDNDCESYAAPMDPTYVQSMGPNGIDDDTDDISVLITRGCPH